MLDLKYSEDEGSIEWENDIRYDVVLNDEGDTGAFASESASVISSGAAIDIFGLSGLIIGALGMALLARRKKEPTEETA